MLGGWQQGPREAGPGQWGRDRAEGKQQMLREAQTRTPSQVEMPGSAEGQKGDEGESEGV